MPPRERNLRMHAHAKTARCARSERSGSGLHAIPERDFQDGAAADRAARSPATVGCRDGCSPPGGQGDPGADPPFTVGSGHATKHPEDLGLILLCPPMR